jgi:hypothetical protein
MIRPPSMLEQIQAFAALRDAFTPAKSSSVKELAEALQTMKGLAADLAPASAGAPEDAGDGGGGALERIAAAIAPALIRAMDRTSSAPAPRRLVRRVAPKGPASPPPLVRLGPGGEYTRDYPPAVPPAAPPAPAAPAAPPAPPPPPRPPVPPAAPEPEPERGASIAWAQTAGVVGSLLDAGATPETIASMVADVIESDPALLEAVTLTMQQPGGLTSVLIDALPALEAHRATLTRAESILAEGVVGEDGQNTTDAGDSNDER